jgi:predicted amidohydrolase YtcJ
VIPIGSKLTGYIGPRFITGEEFVPEARMVIADEFGRVRALLLKVPTPNPYPTVTLPGALAVAGLHDAHLHIEGIGQGKENLDLTSSTSAADLKKRVAAFAKEHPGLTVLKGRGWDQSRFPKGAFPTWKDIDGAVSMPVYLTRVDGHAALVNKLLLDKAGITKDTKDPAGGRILRDDKGEPTGVLVDNAMDLVAPHLPAPTDMDRERWLIAGMKECADAGDVAVHDMGMSVASAKVLARLDSEGKLPVRVFVYLDGTEDAAYDFLGTLKNTEMLYFMGVKLYADGALGSRGAALLEDYADEPGKKGLMVTEPALLEARIEKVHAKGYQAAVHAIGDRANRVVIDLLTKHHSVDIRDRLEHAQVMSVDDIPRLYVPRITASMQPTHATSDMRWAEARVGKERLKGAYAWKTVVDSGADLALGSDAPVEDVRPAWGIYAAITRQDHEGTPAGGFTPEQKLTTAQALQGFARGAAWAVNLERHDGALTPGMFFDVSLFDVDAAADPDPKAWLKAKPMGTVVSGRLRQPLP